MGHLVYHQQCFILKTLISKTWLFKKLLLFFPDHMLTNLALFTQQKYITTCQKRPFLTVFTIPLDSLLMSQNASFGQDKNPLGSFQYTSYFQSMCKNVIGQIENLICRSDRSLLVIVKDLIRSNLPWRTSLQKNHESYTFLHKCKVYEINRTATFSKCPILDSPVGDLIGVQLPDKQQAFCLWLYNKETKPINAVVKPGHLCSYNLNLLPLLWA